MTAAVNKIPKGYHTITPSLTVRNAAEAIAFYKEALGAEERVRMSSPDGKISHAELKIGDSIIFLADEIPAMGNKSPQTLGGSSGSLFLYVEDVDQFYERAVHTGAKPTMPPTDMFWGDRYGTFVDPYGHSWGVGTHVEDLTAEETRERANEFYAQIAQKKSA
jgi:PhnB protein